MRPTRPSTAWLPTRQWLGLKEIQATIKEHAALNFRATTTSAPIRQDDFVAYFIKFGPDPDKYPGLSVLELKDGMILNHWVYPAP